MEIGTHVEYFDNDTMQGLTNDINDYSRENGFKIISISTLFIEEGFVAFVVFESEG